MLNKIWGNIYARTTILLAIAFIGGVLVAYLTMQTTIKTQEIKTNEDKKTIDSLKVQLATSAQGHTVVVTQNGVVTSTTDWNTHTTSNTSSKDTSDDRTSSETKTTEITNPKYLDIFASGGVDMSSGTPLAGIGFTYNVIGPFIIGGMFSHGFGKSMEIVSIAAGLRV